MDVVANALPGYTNNLTDMSITILRASTKLDAPSVPKSFNDLMKEMPEIHLVAVFGEEDNKFRP